MEAADVSLDEAVGGALEAADKGEFPLLRFTHQVKPTTFTSLFEPSHMHRAMFDIGAVFFPRLLEAKKGECKG